MRSFDRYRINTFGIIASGSPRRKTCNGAVIVKMLERQDPPASDVATGKASLKTELVNERRNRFYASYMGKARERMKVNINRELIAQIVA